MGEKMRHLTPRPLSTPESQAIAGANGFRIEEIREEEESGDGKDQLSSIDEGAEDRQGPLDRLSAVDLSQSPFAFKLIDDAKSQADLLKVLQKDFKMSTPEQDWRLLSS